MPNLTARKLILIAGIAALALSILPIRQAGSAVDVDRMHYRVSAPTPTVRLCPVERLRICRSIRGRKSAYPALTPISGTMARTGYLDFKAM